MLGNVIVEGASYTYSYAYACEDRIHEMRTAMERERSRERTMSGLRVSRIFRWGVPSLVGGAVLWALGACLWQDYEDSMTAQVVEYDPKADILIVDYRDASTLQLLRQRRVRSPCSLWHLCAGQAVDAFCHDRVERGRDALWFIKACRARGIHTQECNLEVLLRATRKPLAREPEGAARENP